jgi:hypothetical protein
MGTIKDQGTIEGEISENEAEFETLTKEFKFFKTEDIKCTLMTHRLLLF